MAQTSPKYPIPMPSIHIIPHFGINIGILTGLNGIKNIFNTELPYKSGHINTDLGYIMNGGHWNGVFWGGLGHLALVMVWIKSIRIIK
jgi:hypothetical protein